MLLRKLLFILLFLGTATLYAQKSWEPDKKELSANLSFLSSPLLEGREAGERGCFIAAEYIASMMQMYGLEPYGNKYSGKATYFENFDIIRTRTENYNLVLTSAQGNTSLTNNVDFTAKGIRRSFDFAAPVVFAGYGLVFPENSYDSYKGIDVNGKIAVVINGFPDLPSDTTCAQYKTLKAIQEKDTSLAAKQKMAIQRGAVALLVINLNGIIKSSNPVNNILINESASENIFPKYEDAAYSLASDGTADQLPCFTLSSHASKLLFANNSIELAELTDGFKKNSAPAVILKPIKVRLSANVKHEAVRVRNVIGMVKGIDTTKYVVVAAHYDHLGRRGDAIFNGADDNASGVAGILSLAKYWSNRNAKPACNIIFAAWTAEEKGMLGSRYFVQNFPDVKRSVLLNINFDMISRPDAEDVENKIISIGILKGRKNLRAIAEQNNAKLAKPFTLDLWETAGDGGSDYIAFAEHQIPVMAFFSGMHDDYHLPLDTKEKIDMDRMIRIVALANGCLTQFLQEAR